MTRKRRRLQVLVLCMLGLGTAAALTLAAFQDHLVFFHAPSDLAAGKVPPATAPAPPAAVGSQRSGADVASGKGSRTVTRRRKRAGGASRGVVID